MKTAVLILGLAFSGCYTQEQWGESIDQDRVTAAMQGWQEAGNPLPSKCQDDRKHLTVLFVSPDELLDRCPSSGKDGMGCTRGGEDWDGTYKATIFMNDTMKGQDTDDTMEHELRHFLSRCSFGTPDADHVDTRVWFQYEGHSIL